MILIFTNGVYLTSHNRFYDNEHVSNTLARKINSEYDSDGYLIMKKFFNFKFDLYHSKSSNVVYKTLKKINKIPLSICHLVSTYHNDWRNIPTPFFDKLLDSNLDSNDKYLFYVSFGKIFHHFDEKDQWSSVPMVYGKNSFFIVKLVNTFLSNYQLCIGRYGIEHVMPMGDIWMGLVFLLKGEGTPSRTITKILNNILTGKSIGIERMYNEQSFILENPKFLFIPNEKKEIEFDKLEYDILHFEFQNEINNDIQKYIFDEFSLIIQKTNQAYIEATYSYKGQNIRELITISK